MDNYVAIKNMSKEQMEIFLDNIFLTGLNLGMNASIMEHDSDVQNKLPDNNPYDLAWLSEDAEDATRLVTSEDGDIYMLNALVKVILNIAQIESNSE